MFQMLKAVQGGDPIIHRGFQLANHPPSILVVLQFVEVPRAAVGPECPEVKRVQPFNVSAPSGSVRLLYNRAPAKELHEGRRVDLASDSCSVGLRLFKVSACKKEC